MPPSRDNSSDPVLLTRKLHSSGNSTVLTIPPEILEAAGLSAGDIVSFEIADGGGVLLDGVETDDPEEEEAQAAD